MGNQTSQAFALLYLDDVDRYIKEKLRVKHYLRYMDDMIIFVKDKEQAKEYKQLISTRIEENGLLVNPKSQIIKIENGFNFLGWQFKLTCQGKIIQKVKRETKKRIIQKCKRKIKTMTKKEKQILCQSYKGLIGKGDSFVFLKKIKKIVNYKCQVKNKL